MNAPLRPSDFIGELCIALAHRWEPERRFMVITGYLDESGTHGGATLSVMAGFIADARQWRKFEKRAGKLFARYRVDVFHTIDVRRTDKDFAGWPVDRKITFLDEFHHIINETLEHGVAAVLREEDYAYYLGLPWPAKARKDTRYALMFRACMADFLDTVIQTPHWRDQPEPRLNLVVECGHPNAPDLIRLYNGIKAKFGGPSNKALSGLTFEPKTDCLPLAAADLFAYSAYGQEVGQKPIGIPKGPLKSEASYTGNMHRVPLLRTVLDGLYQQTLAIPSAASSESSEGPLS